MSSYTPPAYNAINFTFEGSYTAPAYNAIYLLFGEVAGITMSASTSSLYPDTGFNKSLLRWTSTVSGPYTIEVGGTGHGTGYIVASGIAIRDIEMETYITSSMITSNPSYSGYGTYTINIYVKSSDDIWTPNNYSA